MRGIFDAIYWKLHSSYLRNRREDAARFLSMLEHELSEKPAAISEIGAHAARFRRIADEIKSGRFGPLHGGCSAPADPFPLMYVEPTLEEKEFHKVLMRRTARSLLFPLLGLSPEASMVHEYDMAEFGRCDFLVRDRRRVAVVEVKMGAAPFSVASQVGRYRLAAELEMCIGLYDEVDAVVLAEAFPKPLAADLSALGIRMAVHSGRDDRFSLYNEPVREASEEEYPWI